MAVKDWGLYKVAWQRIGMGDRLTTVANQFWDIESAKRYMQGKVADGIRSVTLYERDEAVEGGWKIVPYLDGG